MIDTDGEAERLGTSEVAEASGYSVQQVRDLEASGVIAPAHRADNGYRRFDGGHVRDLRAYRDLAYAVGPVEARRVLREVRVQPPDRATSLVSSLHTRLNRERDQALAAQRALLAIRDEATTDAPPVAGDTMTITELAQALGVRASTLRFWEGAGLVEPERITTRAGSARRYPLAAIREARIAAALRAAGYRIPEVQRAVAAVRELRETSASVAALEGRIDSVARRTLALLRAGAILGDIIAPDRARPDQ